MQYTTQRDPNVTTLETKRKMENIPNLDVIQQCGEKIIKIKNWSDSRELVVN